MYADLLEELRAIIAAEWAEVIPNGIWRTNELLRISFDQTNKPLAVIDLDFRSYDGMAADDRAERGPITIYYVVHNSSSIDDVEAKLEGMVNRLHEDRASYSFWQETNASQSTSIRLPLNEYFIASQQPYWAGAVIIDCVTGV